MLSHGFGKFAAGASREVGHDRAQAAGSDLERKRWEVWEYRPEIDGLRAIAVIAVVGFHAFPEYVSGGFVGVDVFFVISGFLISGIIFKHLCNSDFSLADFYARRARRILPALCVMLAACLLFGYYALLPDEFTILGKHMAAAAAFAANLAFWRDSGYFAPAAQFEPLLHLWSLGIEEQFYLLWPVALLLAWKRRLNIALSVAVLTAGSFILNLVLVQARPAANFYFPLSRFWELGLGCLLATVKALPAGPWARARRGVLLLPPGAVRALRTQLPVIGVALIAVAVCSYDGHTAFPGIAALLPAAGAVCIIAAPGDSWFKDKVLAHRALVFIGLISYPLYLWHWPILSFAAILHSGTPHLIGRAATVLLALVLSVLTFQFIELPIRTLRRLRVSVALAGLVAAVGILAFAVYAQQGLAGRFDSNVLAIKQPPKQDPLCRASIPQQYQFNYCRRTNLQAPKVAFLGDSQALGVYEGTLSTLGTAHPLLLLARGGCPPVLNVHPSPGVYDTDARRRTCNSTWTAFADFIRDTRPPMVVLVGDGARFFVNPDASSNVTARVADERAFKEGLASLVGTLEGYSRVIYVLEIPTFNSAPACFLRPVRLPGNNCSPWVARNALAASRSAYEQNVREVQREYPDLVVVDPMPSLCNARSCSQVSPTGQVLYSDQMHLSPAGGRRFAQISGLASFIAHATGSSGG
jgi:peptidoglycan/LPS O-acetylase OafA/YrhL